MAPLTANVLGFLSAFMVSYYGHRYFTFDCHTHKLASLGRLFLVGIANLALNELAYALFLALFNDQYLLALCINLILLAVLTFFVNKYWVFKT